MTQYFSQFVFITSGITIGNDALLKLSASPKNDVIGKMAYNQMAGVFYVFQWYTSWWKIQK